MTKDTRDDSSPAGRAVPPSLLELWVFAVGTMPADVRDTFASRIRRAWPTANLVALDAAVAARPHALAEPDAERHGA